MIPLALLIIYCVVVFFALVWCENTYHDGKPVYKAGEPLQSGSLSTKREPVYKAGEPLQSGRASTKRESLI
jgi:hypothetical protein